MNSQEYNLNIRPGVGIPPIVRVSQDDVGRPLAFKMYDGASALTIASGTTIEIHGTKRSGLGFTEACTWSGSTVSVDTTEAMTQESGAIPTELVFTSGTDVIASANFTLVIEPSPHSAAVTDGTVAEAINAVTRCETYAQAAEDAAADAASDAAEAAETAVNALIATIPADYTSLTTQVATNTQDIGDIKADLEDLEESGVGLSDSVKNALLACFQNVAWVNENGQTYYDALYDALYEVTWSITNNLTGCVNSNAATSVTKNASYSATITANTHYTLDTVTVTMGGTDVTSTVYSSGTITIPSVTGAVVITATAVTSVSSISAVYTQSGTVYATDTLDSLKSDLVVTATYGDSSTSTVASSDYTLSGTLTSGTSTVTVTYSGCTTTFTVTVTAILYPLENGTHTFTDNERTLTVTRGCHFVYEAPNATSSENPKGAYLNLSTVSENDTSATTATNVTLPDVLFTIPASSTVRFEFSDISNINLGDSSSSTNRWAMNLRSNNTTTSLESGVKLVNETEDFYTQYTVDTATDITCVFMYVRNTYQRLEMTMKMYVDGVRWI